MTKTSALSPVHPGEVLRKEYLAPLCITPNTLAAALRMSRTCLERLVREETSLTRDTAFRLAGYFGTAPEFWLGMQARFDEHATRRAPMAETLRKHASGSGEGRWRRSGRLLEETATQPRHPSNTSCVPSV
jgi:antitoxin HigA-1